jgi:MFS family permease
LAGVGLGTFWAVTVAGQDLAREMLVREGVSDARAAERAKFAYSIVQTTGGGLGLLAFGPISARIGRRRAFIGFQLLAFAIVPITCFAPQNYGQLLVLLPVFGFLTLAIHSGYAIYFPELFPTALRATGASFCFNGGRILAVLVLVFSGWLKALPGMDLRWAVTLVGGLFLLGAALMPLLPETNRQELPE